MADYYQILPVGMSSIELTVMCAAGMIVFRRSGATFAESLSYAVITTLMMISAVFQLALLTGLPWISIALEIIYMSFCIGVLIRYRTVLTDTIRVLTSYWRAHPVSMPVYTLGMLYLGLLALMVPPDPAGWKALGQIVLFQKNGIPAAYVNAGSTAPFMPINHAVLPYMFLRGHTDFGVNLFGLMAYVSIAGSTYALARRYAWPPTALTTALIVVGMPRLVYHAVTPGMEIIPAAVGLFCVLAVYRSVERLKIQDLLLLMFGLCFCVSAGKAGMIFPAVFLVLSWLLLVRRHGAAALWVLIRENRWKMTAAVIPLLLFSQVWLMLMNSRTAGQYVGDHTAEALMFNSDGLQGALANMIRYFLESVHLTLPLEHFSREVLDVSLIHLLQAVAAALPEAVSGLRGAVEPFSVNWIPNGCFSWFGPFAFLLIFPALAYAVSRGPRRLKALAVALWAYFYLIILIFAWSPLNVRFFSLFFVCGGFSIAFLLPPWRFSRRAKQAIQTVSVVLFLYAVAFNTAKPLLSFDAGEAAAARLSCVEPAPELTPGLEKAATVWTETHWGRDRHAFARRYFGDNRVDHIAALLDAGARVVIIADRLDCTYPFARAGAALRFVTSMSDQTLRASDLRLKEVDYILCIERIPDDVKGVFSVVKTWEGRNGAHPAMPAFLLKTAQAPNPKPQITNKFQ